MPSISKSDNMAALALRGLAKSSLAMGQAMERLSTGKRINRASDDSSGLSIASKMHAQTLGLNMSVRHANSGINILQTMEGSLSDQHNILQRMRELAVQSASDTNTGTDRTFIQDEINQLNSELNKISVNTEYNGIKLLDGTLNRKITVGSDAESQIIIDAQSTDSSTLGAFQLYSIDEHTAAAGISSHAEAKSLLNSKFLGDYTLSGSFTTKILKVNDGADAHELANAFNNISNQTNIKASAITKAQLWVESSSTTYNFSLEGKSTILSEITSTIDDKNDLTSLKDAINAVTSSTGISATLTLEKSRVNLIQADGYDIIVGDVTGGEMLLDAADAYGETNGMQVTLKNNGVDDSSAVVGTVTLSSDRAFSVSSDRAENHFATDIHPKHSSFNSIGNLNLKTKVGSTKSLAIIDSALTTISRLRSVVGAKENHLLRAVDNLTTISTATQKAKDQVEGANFASETSKLASNQILQQASTAMLAQANASKQGVLSLLQG